MFSYPLFYIGLQNIQAQERIANKKRQQLQLMKDQLSKMKSALDEIAGSLNIDDLENKTDDEKVEAIKNAINALNNKAMLTT